MQFLFLVWLIISIIGCVLMILDKYSAVHQRKRISEKTLILIAICGAALMMWITMYLIHHKTKHLQFTAGLPCIIVIHAVLLFIGLN